MRVLHTCVDSTWRHVSAMFISSTAERSIGEINTRPPRYLLVSAGNLSSPCYDEQNKTWFHASLPLPLPLRYDSQMNPTPRPVSDRCQSYSPATTRSSKFSLSFSFSPQDVVRYVLVFCFMRATFLLEFITHNTRLGVCTNREAPHHVNFPQPPVTSSLLVPNWFPASRSRTPPSPHHSSLNVPYRTKEAKQQFLVF